MTEHASPTGARALKILIVSQYYRPEHAMIPALLAEDLSKRGHHVQVLTGFPNYPAGELYPNYRIRWRQRERLGGVVVNRVPLYIDHSDSAPKRIANYVSFAAASATCFRLAQGADVVYVYATQMTPALGPALWHAAARVPFVLHVQDLWPDSITGSQMLPRRAARFVELAIAPWLRAAYARAAATIGISTRMTSTLVARGVPASRAHTVHNWADESASPIARNSATDGDARRPLRFVYAGNLGDLQDVETIIRAAARVRDDSRFTLELFGSGIAEQRLRALASQLEATNVIFRGRVDPSEMPKVYASSDFQVLALADLPAMQGTIPSKLAASLLHGVPVVSSIAGAVHELVNEHQLGFTAHPGDPDSLEGAFRAALATTPEQRQELRERAQKIYDSVMSLSSGIDSIERILVDAAAERKRRSDPEL